MQKIDLLFQTIIISIILFTLLIMETTNKVYTITFGDVAENHAKMQKIGTLHESGYSVSRLEAIQQKLV